jgi:hypothetical protein
MEVNNTPQTLIEAIKYFSDPDRALDYMVNVRWPEGVTCPHCIRATGEIHNEVSFLSTRRIWKCKVCKKQFSVKVGSVMEDSPIKLELWLAGFWLVCSAKNGILLNDNYPSRSHCLTENATIGRSLPHSKVNQLLRHTGERLEKEHEANDECNVTTRTARAHCHPLSEGHLDGERTHPQRVRRHHRIQSQEGDLSPQPSTCRRQPSA